MKIFQTEAHMELPSPFSSSTMLILLSKASFWVDEFNFDQSIPYFAAGVPWPRQGLSSGSSWVLQVGFPKLTGFPGTIPISWSAGSNLALPQPFGTYWCFCGEQEVKRQILITGQALIDIGCVLTGRREGFGFGHSRKKKPGFFHPFINDKDLFPL